MPRPPRTWTNSNQCAKFSLQHTIIEVDTILTNQMSMSTRFLQFLSQQQHNCTPPNLQHWEQRWDRLIIHHTTSPYQHQQRRLLAFLTVDPLKLFEVFIAVGERLSWRWSTRQSYFDALTSAMTILDLPISTLHRKNGSFLQAQAMQEIPLAPAPLLIDQYREIVGSIVTPYTLGLQLAFTLGQRLPDVAKLHAARISRSPWGHLAVTLVEGKVIPRIGPYTIWVPQSALADGLLALATWCKHQFLQYLFPSDFVKVWALRLGEVGPKIEVRSVRKGGLIHLANSGVPASSLLLLSRHSSLAMLYKYLDHGAQLHEEADRMSAVVQDFVWHTSTQDGRSI